MSTAFPQPVRAWVEQLTIPTYPVLAADPNPMFFETRNIQGAKGNIYPHPFTDQLSSHKEDRTYEAVYLENEYIQMLMLPEIGGRIFAGLDKTNGYDFFYRHKVIKPSLIGVFGPWISGGVEFNWPQHHRPTTFEPVDYALESHPDGSVTLWMGEHAPLNRTKGMVGICLYPGKALVETKGRLFNRTPFPQTFLWWENAGVHINEQYQVIFPPDVHYAVYHVKNPVIGYPIGKGPYLSNDYGEGTDISYWANSPQATSFFAGDSKYPFFGGYDHASDAGVVHVADPGISPGKKFFTWANGPFGHSWQKALMDDTGEYLELMAGVYTDNQPDFTWIAPYETKTFSQFWYPVQKLGGLKNANLRAALNLEVNDGQADVNLNAVEVLPTSRVTLSANGQVLLDQTIDLAPGASFHASASVPAGLAEQSLLLRVVDAQGNEIIHYQPEAPWDGWMPEPYQAPAAPEAMTSIEDLYLTGLHLEQYRHPALKPEAYWLEALRRDPEDSRSNLALGRLCLRQGEYSQAEAYFRTAVKRLTKRNLNPPDGEAHYQLGLVLQYQGKYQEAYPLFYKATWSYAWRSPAYTALAQLDCRTGDWASALEHAEAALQAHSLNHKARNLKCAVMRRVGQSQAAAEFAAETLRMDPLDHWARYEHALAAGSPSQLAELPRLMRGDVQTYLDIALDYAAAGLWQEATDFLQPVASGDKIYPMVAYALGYFAGQMGKPQETAAWYRRGAAAAPDYCFPWRLEEMQVLRDVLANNPQDGRAAYYLGNLLYDKKQFTEAMELWQRTTQLEPGFAIPWRNLGLAAFNRHQDIDRALEYFAAAWTANPHDARILLEYDQLRRRKGISPADRLALLESHLTVVNQRDDLIIEQISLCNRLGQPEKALQIAAGHTFHAWEGGEGRVAGQYANAHWLLGRQALEANQPAQALEHFQKGLEVPENLGVVPFAQETIHLVYYLGLAQAALGQTEAAKASFEQVAATPGWMHAAYYQALALRQLGKEAEAVEKLRSLSHEMAKLVENGPQFNYFFSGKPSPIFEDDLKIYNRHAYLTALGLARLGLGDKVGARSAFGQALSLNPANLFAHEELRRL